jgi:hypothetical protein
LRNPKDLLERSNRGLRARYPLGWQLSNPSVVYIPTVPYSQSLIIRRKLLEPPLRWLDFAKQSLLPYRVRQCAGSVAARRIMSLLVGINGAGWRRN